MDIFDLMREEQAKKTAPLAERRKPQSLEDFVGQEEILGEGTLLRRMIEADRLRSMIFFGPTGIGKTSLAQIISQITSSYFVSLNAVTSGIAQLKEVIKKADEQLVMENRSTILFIDEIHRFNKAQQDALLPHVEKGTVIFIGATTENPYFEVNAALLSRSLIFEMKPLEEKDLLKLLKSALSKDGELLKQNLYIEDSVLEQIVKESSGDARRAMNILELAALTTKPEDGKRILTKEIISQSTQTPYLKYDKGGDYHYDVISAFIKSVRGSDPQAAIYYLAQMLISGEDPKFIARRLIILAAEDIGLADPQALVVSNACFEAIHKIGMPEARIILSETTIYLCLAEKSNSAYLAINDAYNAIKELGPKDVPAHLQDSTKKRLSKSTEVYLYPHDEKVGWVTQDYLPEKLKGRSFYEPKNLGKEENLVKEWKNRIIK
ncbi:MAG: replication-associated recombination protein A [Tissierellia bacterium]|nr:replication-associated recombination protein A [Tissierellia bacterium]